MTDIRHRWGDARRFTYKTERTCLREGCHIVKVTRHEGGLAWVEYWSGLDRLGTKRPPCGGQRALHCVPEEQEHETAT